MNRVLFMQLKFLPAAFLIFFYSNLLAQKNDCNLLMDKGTVEGRIKSTHRTAIIEQPDLAFGIILQNYSGNLKMLIDWAIDAKRIKQKFTAANKNKVTFVLSNGQSVNFEIKEPQAGSGARKQSWGTYELGGMIDMRTGQADTLQQAPVKTMLLSFYGLPPDTVNTISAKDYFVKSLPCVK